MKKETKKLIIKVILLAFIFLFMFGTRYIVSANPFDGMETGESYDLNTGQKLPSQSYEGIGPGGSMPMQTQSISKTVDVVLGILQFIGFIIAAIMIVVLGVDYFVKGKTPQGKAEVDERMKSILLGTILIVGATLIITAIRSLAISAGGQLAG